MPSSPPPPAHGFVRAPDVAHAIWYVGSLMRLVASGPETANQYALVDTHTPRGGEPPMHLHHREDEAYFVLEGALRVYLGALELPPPAGEPPDVQAMIQALTRYGVDVVGPPPGR